MTPNRRRNATLSLFGRLEPVAENRSVSGSARSFTAPRRFDSTRRCCDSEVPRLHPIGVGVRREGILAEYLGKPKTIPSSSSQQPPCCLLSAPLDERADLREDTRATSRDRSQHVVTRGVNVTRMPSGSPPVVRCLLDPELTDPFGKRDSARTAVVHYSITEAAGSSPTGRPFSHSTAATASGSATSRCATTSSGCVSMNCAGW